MESREAQLHELESRLFEACGVLNVAHARLVELTEELIRSELWRGYGIRSVEHWLILKAGLSPERARHIVQVAAAAPALPATTKALSDGELSFEQVHAVARHAGKFRDEQAASFARNTTVPQIRRTLSRYMFEEDAASVDETESGAPRGSDATDPREHTSNKAVAAVAAGRLSRLTDADRFRLYVDAPPDAGALIETALTEAKNALFEAGQPNVTWFEAMLEICNRSLTTASPASRADKYRVFVHLDTEGGWLNSGPALPPALVDKLTCAGRVAPVWETGGFPVNVGRAARIVPDRTRRLVENRDRGCRYPGCTSRAYLEVHHVIHWRDGGSTDTCNLVCLCAGHHDAHHRGEFLIAGSADSIGGLRFTDNRGRLITVGRPRPPDAPLPMPPSGHRYVHPVGEPVQSRWVYFAPPETAADRARAPTPA